MFGYRGFGKGRFARGVGSWTGIQIVPGPVTITYGGYSPLVVYTFVAPIRITTAGAEIWSSGQSSARVTTLGAEIYRTLDDAKARVTTLGVEVWHNIAVGVADDDSWVSIIW